jgi:hypothetical protein
MSLLARNSVRCRCAGGTRYLILPVRRSRSTEGHFGPWLSSCVSPAKRSESARRTVRRIAHEMTASIARLRCLWQRFFQMETARIATILRLSLLSLSPLLSLSLSNLRKKASTSTTITTCREPAGEIAIADVGTNLARRLKRRDAPVLQSRCRPLSSGEGLYPTSGSAMSAESCEIGKARDEQHAVRGAAIRALQSGQCRETFGVIGWHDPDPRK